MIPILLPLIALVAAIISGLQGGAGRRWCLHTLAISTSLLIIALAPAASAGNTSECVLDFAPPVRDPVAKVRR